MTSVVGPARKGLAAGNSVKPLQVPTFEADDILATVARRALLAGCTIVTLHSTDKDMIQLISDRVRIHNGKEWVTEELVTTRYGVRPDQFIDYQSIVGDTIDSIPGATGIGPVGAKTILQKYGSINGAIEVARKQSTIADKKLYDKNLPKLLEQFQNVMLARQLVRLHAHVPIGGKEEET